MDLIWNGQRLLTPGGNLHIVHNPSTPIVTFSDWFLPSKDEPLLYIINYFCTV